MNPLTRALEKRKTGPAPLLDLTESNPTRCGFRTFGEAEGADPRNRPYEPDPRGLPEARQAVAGYYASKGAPTALENIFLTAGTSEAYSLLFHLFCDPGEEVLCASPAYPLLDHLAAYAGVRVRRFSSAGQARSAGRAPLMVLVNPANPTGCYVPEEDWNALTELGLPLVSDEVFFDFDWQTKKRATGASCRGSLCFTLGGVSKLLGLPQMKLAWIVLSGPEAEVRAARARLEVLTDIFLSVSAPVQHALPRWMEKREAFTAEVLERVKMNFKTLRGALPGAALQEPEGGWYALLPVRGGDEETALALLEKRGVLTHPGYLFDLGEDCLVLSLLPPPAVFSEAARCLAEELK